MTLTLIASHSNPIFSLESLAYDSLPPNSVWLQKNHKFRRYKEVYIYKQKQIYFDSPDQLIRFEENVEVGGEI